jgi:transcription elongation factor GreA
MKEELDKARTIDAGAVPEGRVGLGSRLEVVDTITGESNVYSVLGPWDGTPEEGVLSYTSPIARALYGKSEGDEVEIELPKGVLHLRIVKVGSHFSS